MELLSAQRLLWFEDEVNLAESLLLCSSQNLAIDPLKVSYFLSHATVVATPGTRHVPLARKALCGHVEEQLSQWQRQDAVLSP